MIFNSSIFNYDIWIFHDGGRYDIETSLLICSANQWTGFYMIKASVMKELTAKQQSNLVKTLEMLNEALLGIIQETDTHIREIKKHARCITRINPSCSYVCSTFKMRSRCNQSMTSIIWRFFVNAVSIAKHYIVFLRRHKL